jgi:hypothetical protein
MDHAVQRNVEGIATIGDPRNDSHTVMSQLHLAMLKAHNAFVDEARRTGHRSAAVPRERAIDWTLFFDTRGATQAQRSEKIDGKLVRALIALPVAVTGECEVEDYHCLAVRDFQCSQGVGLPSGEAVACHIGITLLTPEQVGLAFTGWQGETPLWY